MRELSELEKGNAALVANAPDILIIDNDEGIPQTRQLISLTLVRHARVILDG